MGKLKEYISKYLDKTEKDYLGQFDGYADFEMTSQLIDENNLSLEDPVVKEALESAIRRTPSYKTYQFLKAQKEAWELLTPTERFLTKAVSAYNRSKNRIKSIYWEAKRRIQILLIQDTVPFPEAEFPEYGSEDFYMREWFRMTGQDEPPPVEETIEIEAKIENHFDETDKKSTIKSYNIVPEKNPYEGLKEDEVTLELIKKDPFGNKASFVEEGCLPIEDKAVQQN